MHQTRSVTCTAAHLCQRSWLQRRAGHLTHCSPVLQASRMHSAQCIRCRCTPARWPLAVCRSGQLPATARLGSAPDRQLRQQLRRLQRQQRRRRWHWQRLWWFYSGHADDRRADSIVIDERACTASAAEPPAPDPLPTRSRPGSILTSSVTEAMGCGWVGSDGVTRLKCRNGMCSRFIHCL